MTDTLAVLAQAVRDARSLLDSEEHRYVERYDHCPNGCAFEYANNQSGLPMVRTDGPTDCDLCEVGTVEDEDAPRLDPLIALLALAADHIAPLEVEPVLPVVLP